MSFVTEETLAGGDGIYRCNGEKYILLEYPTLDTFSIDGKVQEIFTGRAIRVGAKIFADGEKGNPGNTKVYALIWKIVHPNQVEAFDACDIDHPYDALPVPMVCKDTYFNVHTEQFEGSNAD